MASLLHISLVIPAFNEAAYLPRLLDTVDAARENYRHGADRIEVIVADNSSTDDTSDIGWARGCRVEQVEKRLIAASRNGGAAVATGEIVAFADADFRVHPETFNFIDSVVAQPGYIGGATGLEMERWSLGIAATWYMILPPLWMLSMDGGVWFCRRSDFQEVGGYDETLHFAEDVAFLWRLKRLGSRRRPREKLATRFTARKLGLEPAFVLNSCRKWDKHGDWHMIFDVFRAGFYSAFSRRRLIEYARQYWYEDRVDVSGKKAEGHAADLPPNKQGTGFFDDG
jgi:glycosyltransferase involved in cell wall biosynthesis